MTLLTLRASLPLPLVELIYNKPELQKPPLGEAPHYIREPGVASRRAYTRFLNWRNAVFRNSSARTSAEQDYLIALQQEMPNYNITLGEGESHYAALVRTFKYLIPIRDEIGELFAAIETEDPSRAAGRIANILEKLVKFRYRAETTVQWQDWTFEAIAVFMYDLFVRTIAHLIQSELFQTAVFSNSRLFWASKTRPRSKPKHNSSADHSGIVDVVSGTS